MQHTSQTPLVPNVGSRDDRVAPFKRDRPIGQLLCQSKGLQPAHIEKILHHQARHGGRFGEAALALGLATEDDIFEALAEQFRYPCVRNYGGGGIDPELVCACEPLGDDAQSFRELRTELLAGVLDRSVPRALAVVSPQSADGRSYVAANLAVACAQLGASTLLIDADMRTPRQHMLFGTDDSPGLSNLLCGRVAEEVAQQPTALPGLMLVSAGSIPPNPVELIQGDAFAALVREWLARFDYVVLDTPAAAHAPEARVIASVAGAALVVARPHAARMTDLDRLLSIIDKGPAALAGVVMNEH